MSATREPKAVRQRTCKEEGCDRERAVLLIEGRRKRASVCVRHLPPRYRQYLVPSTKAKSQSKAKRGPLCGAIKRNGRPCTAEAGKGTDHPGYGRCKHHLGSTRNMRLAAAKEEARDVVGGLPIDVDPTTALLTLVRMAAGQVVYWTGRVHQLRHDEAYGAIINRVKRPLSYGKDGESETITVEEVKHLAPELHIVLRAEAQAMDRLARYSKMAADVKIDERLIEEAKGYGNTLARALEMVFTDTRLALTETQLTILPTIVDEALARIEGTPVIEGTVVE